MNQSGIKVGMCVAYDWEKLRHSLPPIYSTADRICLSLDRDRRTWAGKPFQFDDTGFRDLIAGIDVDRKIDIYEDDFHSPALSPMENDTHQRQLMAQRLGNGGWHVQIDVDEYFIDFRGFAAKLHALDRQPGPRSRPYCVHADWIPLFKRVDSGYLYVDFGTRKPEQAPIATNAPQYTECRMTGGKSLQTRSRVIHDTWARGETDLRQKLDNWGHTHDFDVNSYLNLWRSLDAHNYQYIRNFHPLYKHNWPSLELCPANNIEALIEQLGKAAPRSGRMPLLGRIGGSKATS